MRIKRNLHVVEPEILDEPVVEGAVSESKSSGRPKIAKTVADVINNVEESVKSKKKDSKQRLSKKQKAIEPWAKNRTVALATMMQELKNQKAKEFGANSVYVGSELERIEIGLPMPSLAMEYLLQRNVFPLGVIIQISAKHGSCKSALLAELFRWFYDYRNPIHGNGGTGSLSEVETKISPELFQSIMGVDNFDKLLTSQCDSLEDWQESLKHDLNNFKAYLLGTKEKPGPGGIMPILYAIDSIAGKLTRKTQEGIEESGHAGKGFPVEALSITRYVKTMAGWLRGWPFTVVAINQTKTKLAEEGSKGGKSYGGPKDSRSGGDQLNFSESIDLELKKYGRVKCPDFEGYHVEVKVVKNSMGPDARRIVTRMLWWEEPDEEAESGFRQKTVWDWNWATVHLLAQIMSSESQEPRFKANLKEIGFHLKCTSVSPIENAGWSKNILGMKDDEDAVSWNELGARIHENAELMKQLRKALAIRVRPRMSGDYLEQYENSAKKMT